MKKLLGDPTGVRQRGSRPSLFPGLAAVAVVASIMGANPNIAVADQPLTDEARRILRENPTEAGQLYTRLRGHPLSQGLALKEAIHRFYETYDPDRNGLDSEEIARLAGALGYGWIARSAIRNSGIPKTLGGADQRISSAELFAMAKELNLDVD